MYTLSVTDLTKTQTLLTDLDLDDALNIKAHIERSYVARGFAFSKKLNLWTKGPEVRRILVNEQE